MLDEHFLKICLLLSLIIHLVLLKVTPFHIPSVHPSSSVELHLAYFPSAANKLNKVKTDAKRRAKKQLKKFKPQKAANIAGTIPKSHLRIKKLLKKKAVLSLKPASKPVLVSPDIPKTSEIKTANNLAPASIRALSQKSRSAPRQTAPTLSTHSLCPNRDVLKAYLSELKHRIEQNKKYPLRARRMGVEGKVVVEFCIDQGGKLINVQIKTSSGYAVLDRAAMEAIKDAAPFPPFPRDLAQDKITLLLPMYFRLSS